MIYYLMEGLQHRIGSLRKKEECMGKHYGFRLAWEKKTYSGVWFFYGGDDEKHWITTGVVIILLL